MEKVSHDEPEPANPDSQSQPNPATWKFALGSDEERKGNLEEREEISN